MDDDPAEGIYRAMVEDKDGLPMLGLSALTLGVRPVVDIVVDAANQVHRPAFHPDEANGMSCSPTIADLPMFALPVKWGGTNRKTTVWRIEQADLALDLVAQEDTVSVAMGRHISIGPARTMTFDDYLRAVQSTRVKWKKVTKN
ncbi:MAG TPA: hypothetical protein VE988_07270 [Gemmataceae bacterium]|nr:hypothetical protein [Gemmataceae bacterium]